MTQLLEDALRKVSKLPEDEQDAIASQILASLEDEEAWAKTLRKSPAKLRKLAAEALDEYHRGPTPSLDELL
jgi:ElaB/YqjD/DUF883 family membrane-anchored ribosome-binding protein